MMMQKRQIRMSGSDLKEEVPKLEFSRSGVPRNGSRQPSPSPANSRNVSPALSRNPSPLLLADFSPKSSGRKGNKGKDGKFGGIKQRSKELFRTGSKGEEDGNKSPNASLRRPPRNSKKKVIQDARDDILNQLQGQSRDSSGPRTRPPLKGGRDSHSIHNINPAFLAQTLNSSLRSEVSTSPTNSKTTIANFDGNQTNPEPFKFNNDLYLLNQRENTAGSVFTLNSAMTSATMVTSKINNSPKDGMGAVGDENKALDEKGEEVSAVEEIAAANDSWLTGLCCAGAPTKTEMNTTPTEVVPAEKEEMTIPTVDEVSADQPIKNDANEVTDELKTVNNIDDNKKEEEKQEEEKQELKVEAEVIVNLDNDKGDENKSNGLLNEKDEDLLKQIENHTQVIEPKIEENGIQSKGTRFMCCT